MSGNIISNALSTVADIFRPVQATAQVSQVAAPAPAPEVPAAVPVDDMATLWDNNPDLESNTPKPFTIDMAKLDANVAKADFTSGVTPEQLNAIKSGGDEALAAHVQMVNAVAQQAYKQALAASSKMIDAALTNERTYVTNNIPLHIKEQQLTESLKASNPALYQSPAIAPIVDAIKAQMLSKHPNLTTSELMEKTMKTLNAAGLAFNAPSAAQAAKLKETTSSDFSNFL